MYYFPYQISIVNELKNILQIKILNIILISDHVSEVIFALLLIVGYILQIIGLIVKNHFLIIPGLLAVLARSITNLEYLYYYFKFLNENNFNSPEEEEENNYFYLGFIYAIIYCLISVYYIVLSMVWYHKISAKYHLELRAKRFGEPALNYATLADVDRNYENENVENDNEITIVNEAYNELYVATVEADDALNRNKIIY